MSDLDEALATQDDVESAVLMLAGHDYLVDGIDRVYAAARAYRDLLANGERVWWVDGIDRVYAAARAYRDLLANGQRVWWCEVHGAMGGSDDPGECVYAPRYATACRIDDKLLVDPPIEVEPGEET